MSQVQAGVLSRLEDLLPNQIGSNRRWSQTAVERHIMLADRVVREAIENRYHQQEISLVAGTDTYDLDSEFIDVTSVEYASDGSTYDYYLRPATMNDLDRINLGWRSDGGVRPEFYDLLGAPGTPDSRILVYRSLSSVDAQTIRVTGIGIGGTTDDCPDDVQERCHVPFVMSVLLAKDDLGKAAKWLGRYREGVEYVRRRMRSRYSSGTVPTRMGW